jgi:hypothetical protein
MLDWPAMKATTIAPFVTPGLIGQPSGFPAPRPAGSLPWLGKRKAPDARAARAPIERYDWRQSPGKKTPAEEQGRRVLLTGEDTCRRSC